VSTADFDATSCLDTRGPVESFQIQKHDLMWETRDKIVSVLRVLRTLRKLEITPAGNQSVRQVKGLVEAVDTER
jgi:hypothetical protein